MTGKATLQEADNKTNKLEFQFNPSSIKFSRSANYERKKTQKKGPTVNYTGSSPVELSLQLLLDGVGKGTGASVGEDVKKLMDWLEPTAKTANTKAPSPPRLQFTWGQLKLGPTGIFTGILKSVSVNYKLFNQDGAPIRAEVDIKLEDVPLPPKYTNPTSGGLRTHRTHRLTRGETLQSVAFAEYSDAALWRSIALVNGIDDPFRLRPGLDLLLPEAGQLYELGAVDG